MGWIAKFLDKIFGGLADAYIDCFLFAAIAWFIFSQAYLGGDEAAKYINPAVKFWLNFCIGSGGAIAGAIKMFRSTSYAKLQEKRKPSEDAIDDTEFYRKTTLAAKNARIEELKAVEEAKLLAVKDAAKLNELKADVAPKEP